MIALFLRVVLPEATPDAQGLQRALDLMKAFEDLAKKSSASAEVELQDARAAK